MLHKKIFGLTLLELLVVMAIMAILVVVAVPTYNNYVLTSRRNDAIDSLRQDQTIVEAYIQANGATPTSGQVTIPGTSQNGYYNIAYTQIDSTNYNLVATAVGGSSQANDTGCTTITLSTYMDDIYPQACH